MPNRILKESICTSENIDELTAFQETVFYRLLVNCDDYGRMDARPKILASRLFPLKDIRVDQMNDALRALTSAELVIVYEVDGKPFLQMKTWERHQNIRAKKSKYPEPGEVILQADEIKCKQMKSNASKCSRNPIQSNPIRESNPTRNPNPDSSESETVSEPPAISLPLNDGTKYDVFNGQITEWMALYPAVDVMQELRNMCGWCQGNPTKLKTKSGIVRFVNTWLAKEQDRGGRHTGAKLDTKPRSGAQVAKKSEDYKGESFFDD